MTVDCCEGTAAEGDRISCLSFPDYWHDSLSRQMVILTAKYHGVSLWSIILHQLPIWKPCSQLSALQSELKLTVNQTSTQTPRSNCYSRQLSIAFLNFFLVSCGGVRLSPIGTSTTNWPIVPAPDGRWWVWSSRWNENWQGKPKYWKKTSPVPLCPAQIPHDLPWARTRDAD
jgi:hypothetical protein